MKILNKKQITDLQEIISILTEFENKRKYISAYKLNLLNAFVYASSKDISKVGILQVDEFTYSIKFRLKNNYSLVEMEVEYIDGIIQQKMKYKLNKEHPVHKCYSVADLYSEII